MTRVPPPESKPQASSPQASSSGDLALDASIVTHVARLARLAPDLDEQERLRIELGRILGYFRRLESLDTDGIEPDYHPHQLENRMRPDTVLPSADRDELLAAAARTKDGCLMVPRTVE